MPLLLARSPFFVGNQGFDEGASIVVEIGQEQYTPPSTVDLVVEKSYTLNFGKETEIDISKLILPEIRIPEDTNVNLSKRTDKSKRVRVTVSGNINEVPQSDVVNYYTATKGYFYYEEGYNFDASTEIINNAGYCGSSDVIYKADDKDFYIPLFNPSEDEYTANVSFYLNGNLIKTTQSLTLGYDVGLNGISEENRYQKIPFITLDYNDWESRVLEDGGTIENSVCSDNIFYKYNTYDVDKVVIELFDSKSVPTNPSIVKVLDVVNTKECKYEPIRLEFINKYGCEEELWFMKRSDKTLKVMRETYRASTIGKYSTGDLTEHTYRDFNVTGRESISLNTDWLPESFFETFKQLYLSELVYIHYNGEKLPVNVKSSELLEKKHVNEKLIKYEIDVEFSFDAIGNVV